jgi:hypothetical protein
MKSVAATDEVIIARSGLLQLGRGIFTSGRRTWLEITFERRSIAAAN